jgi:hypothetical protein
MEVPFPCRLRSDAGLLEEISFDLCAAQLIHVIVWSLRLNDPSSALRHGQGRWSRRRVIFVNEFEKFSEAT